MFEAFQRLVHGTSKTGFTARLAVAVFLNRNSPDFQFDILRTMRKLYLIDKTVSTRDFVELVTEVATPKLQQIQFNPYSDKVLQQFDEMGMKQALVTSAPQQVVDILFHSNKKLSILPQIFGCNVVSNADKRSRNPSGYRQIIEHWGAPPQNTLVIGDGKEDVYAARAAGVEKIIIYGNGKSRIKNAVSINSFDKLLM